MLFLLQQCQKLILTLLIKLFKMNLSYSSMFFTLRANRSHSIGFVVARVRLGRLAVVHYSFMSHCLAATATSVRE